MSAGRNVGSADTWGWPPRRSGEGALGEGPGGKVQRGDRGQGAVAGARRNGQGRHGGRWSQNEPREGKRPKEPEGHGRGRRDH